MEAEMGHPKMLIEFMETYPTEEVIPDFRR
jgi:hypothetical protein